MADEKPSKQTVSFLPLCSNTSLALLSTLMNPTLEVAQQKCYAMLRHFTIFSSVSCLPFLTYHISLSLSLRRHLERRKKKKLIFLAFKFFLFSLFSSAQSNDERQQKSVFSFHFVGDFRSCHGSSFLSVDVFDAIQCLVFHSLWLTLAS